MVFTGDQIGAIFAGRILAQYKASGKPMGRSRSFPSANCSPWPQNGTEKLSMVASAVSSKMIEAMAVAEGFNFTQCLTGSYSTAWLGSQLITGS